MIETIETPRKASATPADRPSPSGWYDPDSSAFEPFAGTAAMSAPMTETMARSVEADRRIDAPPAEDIDRT
jgi:hypothetical protein